MKQNISFIQLKNYASPDIEVVRNREWVTFGDNNSYFKYLLDRYTGSPTNNACINGICQMIYGKGLDATDSNKKPEDYAQAITLLNKDCVRKLVNDLKSMGQCAMQVIYSKDRNKIARVEHLPIETLAMEKANKDGEIEAYYYHPNWENYKKTDQPKRIPAFGTSNESIEILYVSPYAAGHYYFKPVDYQGGLQYAELEEEISNYHLNNILNGLAPSMLINFNNGVPNEEERSLMEHKIAQKYSGTSNAGKFILAFNEPDQQPASIDAIQLSDAHNQYQFLSDESMRKIMVSHRVVSPMLLGIKDSTGLGNNADELKTASILMDNTVIRPFQELLLDAFDEILAYNNISLNLYFKTLQPLEFTEVDTIQDEEVKEEETGIKMSAECSGECSINEHDEDIANMLIDLGEDIDDEWELIDERDVDYDDEEELDKLIEKANEPNLLSKVWNFVRTGTARPQATSEQDREFKGDYFKVRYRYSPLSTSSNSRAFCKKMVSANKLYRKEDIIRMGDEVVNKGWGPNGADTYSIWLYKGGGNCHHRWRRETYRFTGRGAKGGDPTSPNAQKVAGFINDNDKKVAMKPKDMPYNGFLPTNKRFK